MTQITVLIEGYARQTPTGWLPSSPATLLEDSGRKILVDPGCHRRLLIQKLDEYHLKTTDIDMIFLTHYHPDHALLAGMFADLPVLDGTTVYHQDQETEYQGCIPGTAIEVIATPGHS